MSPIILPLHGLPLVGAGEGAEKHTVDFLKALPDNYFVLRELRTHPTLEKRQAGSNENRIDMVVIGPAIGVIVLEVKDWNIRRNRYEWNDQYTVRRTDERGYTTDIKNPYAQVDEYYHAVLNLLKDTLGFSPVRVSGFVVYPKLAKAEFENAFVRGEENIQRFNVQERFLIDMKRTIFQDALSSHWDDPLALLTQLVKSEVRTPYEEAHVIKAVNVLVPPKLRVGDNSKHELGYEHLLLMDEEQQKWAFSEQVIAKNYMLDVAGSGKTNVILSRAMHLVTRYFGTPGFRILVLTYSEALARDLKRLLENKIKDQSSVDALQCKQIIVVEHVEHLMEQILEEGLGKAEAEIWRTHVKQSITTSQEYLEYKLPEKCQDIFLEHGERFHLFDYLLIDEVQDFSDFFLDVAMSLLKERDNVFMVGDVGQRLFDRKHNLRDHGMVEERVRVRGNYRMYRSPKIIAHLSWAFLRQDPFIVQELRDQEYEDGIKSKNRLLTQPVFKFNLTREALLKDVYEAIADLIAFRVRPEQVLCIGLPDTLSRLYDLFMANAIPACWANEMRHDERTVILADFAMSKGLERDYVYILDIDRLPDSSLDRGTLFASLETLENEMRRSRIKIFVALTRAIREVHLYYANNNSHFIKELLSLQKSSREM